MCSSGKSCDPLTAAERARSRRDLLTTTLQVWSRTALELLRLRRRRQRLRSALRGSLRPLGEAVYRDDEQATAALKDELRRLDESAERKEAEVGEIATATRKRLQEARLSAQGAARYQNLREATRAALRLPSALRAYALPAES